MKPMMMMFVSFAALSLLAGNPEVRNLTIQQQWPWNQKVDIDFVVDSDDNESYDATVSLYDGETLLDVSTSAHQAFAGDIYALSRGQHRVTFDPVKAGLAAQTFSAVRAVVSLTRVPLYKVFDLIGGTCEDVYKTDLLAGLKGSCETNPVPGVESLVWTAVTNASGPYADYATTKLLLRRIDPGTFHMGTNAYQMSNLKYYGLPITITHSKPYYIGVFEVTQSQWTNVTQGANPSEFTLHGERRPAEHMKFTDIRGTKASWPADGYGKADTGSFLGKLCIKTHLAFDLPTYAQWKYAAQAGTETDYSDGIAGHPSNVSYNDQMAAIARYGGSGGNAGIGAGNIDKTGFPTAAECDIDKGTAAVGSYRPNAWGLYDTSGNAWEVVQDWYSNPGDFINSYHNQTDPVGPSTGSKRWRIGGFWDQAAYLLRSEWTGFDLSPTAADAAHRSTGFRVILMPY